MQSPDPTPTAATLEAELAWLAAVIDARLRIYLRHDGYQDAIIPPAPALPAATDALTDPYTTLCHEAALSEAERLILILALAPWLRPQALDLLFLRNANLDRPFTEFGAAHRPYRAGFTPTRQTALFLLTGEDLTARLATLPHFATDAPLTAHRLIQPGEDALAPWEVLEPTGYAVERVLRG